MTTWQKSSYSMSNGNCVEVGVEPGWQKSSASMGNGNCVETAEVSSYVLMRDTKAPDDGTLAFDREAWRDFIDGIKNSEFDPEVLQREAQEFQRAQA